MALDDIVDRKAEPVSLMEVCVTHTPTLAETRRGPASSPRRPGDQ